MKFKTLKEIEYNKITKQMVMSFLGGYVSYDLFSLIAEADENLYYDNRDSKRVKNRIEKVISKTQFKDYEKFYKEYKRSIDEGILYPFFKIEVEVPITIVPKLEEELSSVFYHNLEEVYENGLKITKMEKIYDEYISATSRTSVSTIKYIFEVEKYGQIVIDDTQVNSNFQLYNI